jgi:hypothetical protein
VHVRVVVCVRAPFFAHARTQRACDCACDCFSRTHVLVFGVIVFLVLNMPRSLVLD